MTLNFKKVMDVIEFFDGYFRKEFIVTGTAALAIQGFPIEEFHDVDIILNDTLENRRKLEVWKKFFPNNSLGYETNINGWSFNINDHRIDIFLKPIKDIEVIETTSDDLVFYTKLALDIIKIKAKYNRCKDVRFFKKHSNRIKAMLFDELRKNNDDIIKMLF